jgi:hypothetical protein
MTNRLIEGNWNWVEPTHGLRDEVLNLLSDSDLAYSPGGTNPTFGAVIREFGEVEHAYVESFKHFTQNFDYRHPDPTIATSVERLKAWFKTLDADMKAAIDVLTDAEIDSKTIARAGGWEAPITMQLDIYLQACLIFLGKAAVYARALNKPLSKDYSDWIG